MEKSIIQKLKKFGENLSILYAEDDKDTSVVVTSILKDIFSKVTSVNNGQEALDEIQKNSYDIVLTDIQMPIIDGLKLSQSIKSIDKSTSIIILTAYEETKYYSKAIDIGVDNFVLKPVKSEQLFDVLYRVAKKITDEKDAEFYRVHLEERVREESEKNRIKDKIAIDMLETLINAYPNPTILYYGNEVKFVNSAFIELFNIKIGRNFELKSILLNYQHAHNEEIYIINTIKGKKIFWLVTKDINLDSQEHKLYTLIDVTIFERQRLQIKQLNLVMKDYIIDSKYKTQTIPVTQNILHKYKEMKDISDYKLGDFEKTILRKTHKDKKSAIQFVADIERENIEDLDEISDTKSDVLDKFDKFEFAKNIDSIYELSKAFNRFAKSINRFLDFSDISYAILTLSTFLSNLDEEKIRDKDLTIMARYIKSILDDFDKWEKSIFIDKDAIDINYMDSSLLNACLQVELEFFQQEREDSDDDVMMF